MIIELGRPLQFLINSLFIAFYNQLFVKLLQVFPMSFFPDAFVIFVMHSLPEAISLENMVAGLNELLLWHGTSREAAAAIANDGRHGWGTVPPCFVVTMTIEVVSFHVEIC
jgi:hypothetical protein